MYTKCTNVLVVGRPTSIYWSVFILQSPTIDIEGCPHLSADLVFRPTTMMNIIHTI